MKRITKLISTAATTMGMVGVLAWQFSGCGADAEAGSAPPAETAVVVRTAMVLHQRTALPIRTSGRVAAKTEVNLSFKISGIVSRIDAEEGQQVAEGQLLARLDPVEIDAGVAQARTAYEKAQRDHDRLARLYRDSVVTLIQLQDAETGLASSRAALDAARFNQRHATIVAPANGRVLRRMAEENELIAAGSPVLRLSASGAGWVIRLGLSDQDVVRMRYNDEAEVEFDAYPGRLFTGRVTEIAEAAQPQSSTFDVEVQIDDPGELLKSGFVGRVALFPSDGDAYVEVPIEALVEGDGQEASFFVVDPETNRARRVTVQVARILDNALAVVGEMEGVTQVITDGAAYLTEGALVEVVEQASSE